jgi:hypothetical protein
MRLWKCASPKETSKPGETEGDFRARLAVTLREQRDLAVEKIRARFEKKVVALQDRILRAEQRVEREKGQRGQQALSTAVAVGATVLGALFGRKTLSVGTVGRASTAMRGAGRVSREKADVARAEDSLEALQQKVAALEAELAAEVEKIEEGTSAEDLPLEEIVLAPRKSDLAAEPVALGWTPWRVRAGGAPVADFPR